VLVDTVLGSFCLGIGAWCLGLGLDSCCLVNNTAEIFITEAEGTAASMTLYLARSLLAVVFTT